MAVPQPGCHRGEQHRDRHGEAAHPQQPGRIAVVGPQIEFGPFPAGLDRVGVGDEALRGLGEPYAPPLGFQQIDAQFPRELADLLRGGGRREVQGAGGGGHRAVVLDGPQYV